MFLKLNFKSQEIVTAIANSFRCYGFLPLIVILFVGCFNFVHAQPPTKQNLNSNCILMTIPKTGTFLALKLLMTLTNKQPSDIASELGYPLNPKAGEMAGCLNNAFVRGLIPIIHTGYFDAVKPYSLTHPNCPVIITKRDLRDMCVSFINYKNDQFERILGPVPLEEKLLFMLSNECPRYFDLRKCCMNAIEAIKTLPNCYVCRFEDLVGKKGGGDDERQKNEIVNIANLLNIKLSQQAIIHISNILFGNSSGVLKKGSSFRTGQIGTWRKYFKEEHKEAFIRKYGALQLALGYSLDDWGTLNEEKELFFIDK